MGVALRAGKSMLLLMSECVAFYDFHWAKAVLFLDQSVAAWFYIFSCLVMARPASISQLTKEAVLRRQVQQRGRHGSCLFQIPYM